MEMYYGAYSVTNSEPKAASLQLLKNKLAIFLKDEFGNERVLYWNYDKISFENRAEHYYIAYKEFPPQTLQNTSSEFEQKLKVLVQQHTGSRISRAYKNSSALLKVFLFFLFFLFIFYFAGIPWLAGRLAKSFPLSYEKELGEKLFGSIMRGYEVDEPKTAAVNAFYKELNFASRYDVKVTVVKNEISNAFAMPGGNIVIHDQILHGISGYEELAALLSHEFIHIEKRHSLKNMFRQLSTTIFISLMIGDANGVASVVLNNADNLKSLSYSRNLEKEADENGAQLLSDRNIGCDGFIKLFKLLKKEAGVQTSEWMSSHPNLDKRIKNIQQKKFCKSTSENNEILHGLFLRLKTAE